MAEETARRRESGGYEEVGGRGSVNTDSQAVFETLFCRVSFCPWHIMKHIAYLFRQ
jgi:hypothetical protein